MKKITKEEIEEILSAHKEWLDSDGEKGKRAELSKADLSRAELNFAELSAADFSGAYLFKAKLGSANLISAYFTGANLNEADLSDANLSIAELSGANLFKADLGKANLCKADLSKASLMGAELNDADFSGADLSKASLIGATLDGAYLNRADLSAACLIKADLSEASLNYANLTNSNLTSVDFENARLEGADISGANIYHIKTHGWEIKDIKCTHVYNYPYYASKEDRGKSRIDFEEGEFENRYKAMPTIELVLSGLQPIDQFKLGQIIDKANGEFDAGLEINSMKKVFKGIEVVLQASSDKDLEKITKMIVREYKNRDLDSKLLAIIRDGKLLGAGTNNLDINTFQPLKGATVNIGDITFNIFGDVKDSALALGANSTATTFITNYTNNKEEIDKALKEFKEEVTGKMHQLAETLTKDLNEKDEKKASGTWKDIIIKASEAINTSDKAAKLTKQALKLYDTLKDLF